jgi:hypothetical protein
MMKSKALKEFKNLVNCHLANLQEGIYDNDGITPMKQLSIAHDVKAYLDGQEVYLSLSRIMLESASAWFIDHAIMIKTGQNFCGELAFYPRCVGCDAVIKSRNPLCSDCFTA